MAGIAFNAQRQPSSHPRPLNAAASSSTQADLDGPTKPSFRDMVMGDKPVPPPLPKRDLIAEKLMTTSFKDGNEMLPQINLDDKLFETLCDPWRDALVIKLLGKFVGYRVLQERSQRLWNPSGGFDILDVDNGYYMVKFDLPVDKETVMSGGPWMLFDHYLCVSQWSPEFAAPNANIQRTMVWIRFPGLNLLYYDENVLLGMASVVSRPIRVDQNTLKVAQGRFARVCVEIDLSKPVIGKIWLRDHWYCVEDEGLHLICAKCGRYGHLTQDCTHSSDALLDSPQEMAPNKTPSNAQTQSPPPNDNDLSPKPPLVLTPTISPGAAGIVYDLEKETHGDWMTVTR